MIPKSKSGQIPLMWHRSMPQVTALSAHEALDHGRKLIMIISSKERGENQKSISLILYLLYLTSHTTHVCLSYQILQHINNNASTKVKHPIHPHCLCLCSCNLL